MKRLLKILALLIFPLSAFATGQVADVLIYQGDTLPIRSNPLEQYLDSKPKRTINRYELTWTSTACYRGYRATWEVINDSLYLRSIEKGCVNKVPFYFDLVKEFGTDKVFASWFTGKTLTPKGKPIPYVYNGNDLMYESELILTFVKGVLTDNFVHNNLESNKSVYSENKDSLNSFIYRNIDWSIIPDLKEESKRVIISIQSGNSMKPDSIKISEGTDNIILNEEALRVVKMLPEWEVYYRDGEVYRMKWAILIIFSEEKRNEYAR